MNVDVDIMDVLDVDPGTDAKTLNPTTSSFRGWMASSFTIRNQDTDEVISSTLQILGGLSK